MMWAAASGQRRAEMWKGEWKAWVFWWLGMPLLGLLFAAVAVGIIASRHHPQDARPSMQRDSR